MTTPERIEKSKFVEFRPELRDFLMEGLSMAEACMAMEATYSCAIEGIRLDKAGFKKLCKELKKKGED